MSDESVSRAPTVFSSKERAALVAKALSEAARRARFSTKRRRSSTAGGLRARRSEQIFRLVTVWSLVGVVAVPIVLYGLYVYFIASSQYSVEARFTVLSGAPLSDSSASSMTGELIAQDTQVILNYIQSRGLIEALEAKSGFKKYFNSDNIDYFSRMSPRSSIEDIVDYWWWHVSAKVSMPSGIVTMTLRAFSPEDSVKLADAVLNECESLVNRLNDQMRKDAMASAEQALHRAEARVTEARTKLELARNAERMLTSSSAQSSFDALLSQTKAHLLTVQQSYDSQRSFVNADAPQMRDMQSQIDAAKIQIRKIEAQMTKTGPERGMHDASDGVDDGKPDRPILSGSMSRLDYAQMENDISDSMYASALSSREKARVMSDIKLMYVNRFVEPRAPEKSNYPHKGLFLFIFSLICFTLWGAIVGIAKVVVTKMS